MGSKTGIEWTNATWNPIIGCSRVSEGCRHCYAEGIAGRFGAGKDTVYSGLTQIVNGRSVWTGQIKETKQLLLPLSWKKPRRIFVNSMSDLFHENVTDEMRDKVFAVMALCPQHTFQVLTKRPKQMLEYLTAYPERRGEMCWRWHVVDALKAICPPLSMSEPEAIALYERVVDGDYLPNVWLGVSVEDQKTADERIPLLLQMPAAVRFISAEPLLGRVHIAPWLGTECCHVDSYSEDDTNATICRECEEQGVLDWVICGGESGPGARPMHPDWARGLRDQCEAAGVPFFFKQWGEWTPGENVDRSEGIVQAADWFDDGWLLGSEDLADDEGHRDDEPDLYRIGKKAAGSLLDGVDWKQFPAVPSV